MNVTYSCRHEYPVDEDGERSRHPEIVIYATIPAGYGTFAPAGSEHLIGEFKSCLSTGGVSDVPRTFYLGQFTYISYSTSRVTFHLEEEQRNTNDQTQLVHSLPFDESFVDCKFRPSRNWGGRSPRSYPPRSGRTLFGFAEN